MNTRIFNHFDLHQYDVLALDLEGTLVTSAVSQIPFPGLFEFLEDTDLVSIRLLFTRLFLSINSEK